MTEGYHVDSQDLGARRIGSDRRAGGFFVSALEVFVMYGQYVYDKYLILKLFGERLNLQVS
jgi:hypothetical protein